MNSALILIDLQNDYFKGGKNELYQPELAASNARHILDYFRYKDLPIYHVQHINISNEKGFFLPNTIGAEIHAIVKPQPGEKVYIKYAPNSFFETGLADELTKNQIDHLVICGMMSHMCIDTTVRAARDLGFTTTVLHNACTTKALSWDQTSIPAQVVHGVIMASLEGAFAKVLTVDEFIQSIQ